MTRQEIQAQIQVLEQLLDRWPADDGFEGGSYLLHDLKIQIQERVADLDLALDDIPTPVKVTRTLFYRGDPDAIKKVLDHGRCPGKHMLGNNVEMEVGEPEWEI